MNALHCGLSSGSEPSAAMDEVSAQFGIPFRSFPRHSHVENLDWRHDTANNTVVININQIRLSIGTRRNWPLGPMLLRNAWGRQANL